MTWFRVDDGFYSHDKVIRIPRARRAEAVGTWTLCGTWAADKERDGVVPAHMVDELGGTEAGAQALVDVGLWRRRRDAFVFVNWAEFQPTREQLHERRQAESQRKAEYRARKARESGAASGRVPMGQNRDDASPVPSRPVDDDDQTLSGRPNSDTGSALDDSSTGVSPVVDSVVQAVAECCARQIHPLVAHDIIAFLDARRGPRAKPVQVPARYYAGAIRQSPAEVQQFIDERGLAA